MAAAGSSGRRMMRMMRMMKKHPRVFPQNLEPRPFPSPLAFSSAWREGDDLLRKMDQREAWDRFYAAQTEGPGHPAHFDWFFGYQEVSGLLHAVLQGLPPGRISILDVGCGTSALGLALYRESARQLDICCSDFSPPALETLRRLRALSPPPRHPLSRLRCRLADAADLAGSFEPASVHLVLDKGTCDALLRSPQGPGRARGLISGCLRVLRPEGRLIQFSDEDPDARMPFLEQDGEVDVAVREVGPAGGIPYYAYTIGRKR